MAFDAGDGVVPQRLARLALHTQDRPVLKSSINTMGSASISKPIPILMFVSQLVLQNILFVTSPIFSFPKLWQEMMSTPTF
jgi:hypothetical protein